VLVITLIVCQHYHSVGTPGLSRNKINTCYNANVIFKSFYKD